MVLTPSCMFLQLSVYERRALRWGRLLQLPLVDAFFAAHALGCLTMVAADGNNMSLEVSSHICTLGCILGYAAKRSWHNSSRSMRFDVQDVLTDASVLFCRHSGGTALAWCQALCTCTLATCTIAARCVCTRSEVTTFYKLATLLPDVTPRWGT